MVGWGGGGGVGGLLVTTPVFKSGRFNIICLVFIII